MLSKLFAAKMFAAKMFAPSVLLPHMPLPMEYTEQSFATVLHDEHNYVTSPRIRNLLRFWPNRILSNFDKIRL